jgi:hypothetical protein
MVFWISGIIDAEVNAVFFNTRRVVQSELNALTAAIDMGPAIQKIRVIFVVSKDSIAAFSRFTKKEAVLDARICLDYDAFLQCSDLDRIQMFVESLVLLIQKTTNFDETAFDRERLIKALKAIKGSEKAG